ncbi:MAG: tetratricopeptide repeat protein [Rhodocyclaceae bacterium]|nr:tetratricopeptide repeat protein [Rhodocyclaceae bacterium]
MIWHGWRRIETGVPALTPRQLAERGLEHFSAGRLTAAESDFRQAWTLDPGYAEMPYNLALVADARGERDAAVEWLREAIALRPGFAEAHFNLATVLAELDDPAGAVGAYHAAENLGADSRSARAGRGWAHYELEEFDAALECFDSILLQTPDHAEARLGRSFVLLKHGRYTEGFADFESRFDTNDIKAIRLAPPGPSWRGEDVSGKTVAVVAEQGFGDTLQFARYAPLLADRGARVALLVQPPLRALATTLAGVEVLALGETPPPYHYHAALLSLPHLLGASDVVPAAVPYFQPDPVRVARWQSRVDALPGLRVGLVWAGDAHPEHPQGYRVDRRRSVPLRQFAPLAQVPGVSFISLQKNTRAAEAHAPDTPFAIADWTAELWDFADTAALVAALDLVISVDTAVAHLAGALARPVWVLSRHGGCWRWLAGQESSPWYPTARVFHQPSLWDWDSVVTQVAGALRDFAMQRASRRGM